MLTTSQRQHARKRQQIYTLRNLFWILMLMLIAIYVGLVAYLWKQTLIKTRSELNYVSSFLVQSVRTTLHDHETLLQGLGDALNAKDVLQHPNKGLKLINNMYKIDRGMVSFVLSRPDGQVILQSGQVLNKPLPKLYKNLAERRSFQEALQSQHLRTGRAYYSSSRGKWVIPMRIAIRNQKGMAVAVMTVAYTVSYATNTWNNIQLLPHIKVALIGSDGYIRYAKPLPPGPRRNILKNLFGGRVIKSTLDRIAEIKGRHAFIEINLARANGVNYLAYTSMPEYDLRSGAFISRNVVLENWLSAAMVPTVLLILILGGGIWAYLRTVKQQNQAADEIGALSAWQQAVLDSADYSIISCDINGRIVSFNKTAERIIGYTANEILGRRMPTDIYDTAEVEQRAAELSQELGVAIKPGFDVFVAKARMGETEEHEWTCIRKDGTRVPMLLSVSPLKTNDNKLIGFLGIADDLSEQKRILASLRESETRYRILFEQANDANFLLKDEFFVDCNSASLRMFGCTREQIIGETAMRYSPQLQPDGRLSSEKAMEKIHAAYNGQPQIFEWSHLRYDGTPFETEVSLNTLKIAGIPHLLATVRDISTRKRNEAELERSRQKLIQHNESLRLLNQVSNRLHGSLDLDDILQQTMHALRGLSLAPNIAIYLLKPEDPTRLYLATSYGFTHDSTQQGASMPVAGSLSGQALAESRVMVSSDITSDERLYPRIRELLTSLGARSLIIVPLFYQKQPIGTLDLIYAHARQFDQLELESLAALGNTMALAIANARHIESLAYQARHDSLTQLPNRTLLHETVNAWLAQRQLGDSPLALLLLDLNHFKEINDTLGHQIGDIVLSMTGERLQSFCREHQAFACRLGGDEFSLILRHTGPANVYIQLANQVLQILQQPYTIKDIQLCLSCSIGVAYFPDHGADSHALLRAADVAMYQAKKRSSGLMLYDDQFDDYTTERLTLASELAQAVSQDQLLLHYQPKLALSGHEVVGLEALVRWQHPRLGLLYPKDFIHLAEMSEVIHPFTRNVIEIAVRDKQKLHKLGYTLPVAINLSAINLNDMRSIDCLQQALTDHAIPAGEIQVELTETALMYEGENATGILNRLNQLGINIAIDDFGTGYSSLSYLRHLPIQALKIDKSFVLEIMSNKQDAAIVRSAIDLAHNLGLNIIAEGIENDATLKLLTDMGCDQGQGYGICRPQPLKQLVSWLKKQKANIISYSC